jgi:hypothetical protein
MTKHRLCRWPKTEMSMKKNSYWLCWGLLVLMACGKDGLDFGQVSSIKIRLINTMPDMNELEVLQNNQRILNAAIGVTTNYVNFTKNTTTFSFKEVGGTRNFNRVIGFNEAGQYTIVAVDSFRKGIVYLFPEDTVNNLTPRQSAIRFLNTGWNNRSSLNLIVRDSVRLVTGRTFDDLNKPNGANVYRPLDSGNTKIVIANAGNNFRLDSTQFQLIAGKKYTIYTTGNTDTTSRGTFRFFIVRD